MVEEEDERITHRKRDRERIRTSILPKKPLLSIEKPQAH